MGYRRLLDHRDMRFGKQLASQLARIGFTESRSFWERPNERSHVGRKSLILLLPFFFFFFSFVPQHKLPKAMVVPALSSTVSMQKSITGHNPLQSLYHFKMLSNK